MGPRRCGRARSAARRGHLLDLRERSTPGTRSCATRCAPGTTDDRIEPRAPRSSRARSRCPRRRMRIECFDISTIHGDVLPSRRWSSSRVAEPDKVAVPALSRCARNHRRGERLRAPCSEVLALPLRAQSAWRTSASAAGPDLLVLDGGKPQLTAAARRSFPKLSASTSPMCGSRQGRRGAATSPWDDAGPVVLPSGSASLYLIKQVRDEAHRFAITFHRELRDKAMTVSVLDEVEGVGATRKKAIMKHFGSMKKLRAASVEDIAAVKGVPAQVAQAVYDTASSLGSRARWGGSGQWGSRSGRSGIAAILAACAASRARYTGRDRVARAQGGSPWQISTPR